MKLKLNGIGRDVGHDCFLFLAFSRRPTDDEIRALHDAFREATANLGADVPGNDKARDAI
jgi:hypothetical protein